MKVSKLHLALLLAAAFFVSFFIGRATQPPSGSSEKVNDTPITEPTVNSATSHLVYPDLSHGDIRSFIQAQATMPKSEQNAAFLSILFNEWIQHAPLEALDFAAENGRDDWLMETLRLSGRENPDGALSWIQDNVTNLYRMRGLEGMVFQGLAQVDPAEAMERAESLKEGPRKKQLTSVVLDEWAQHDPDAVFLWFEGQELDPFFAGAYSQIMYRYIQNNPSESAALVAEMYDTPEKVGFANRAAYAWAEKAPQEALRWANTLEGKIRQSALIGALEKWAYSAEGGEAIDYVTALPNGRDKNELFEMVATKMSQGNPELLAEKLTSLEEGQQTIAVTQLSKLYTSYGLKEATAWFETLPEGNLRDTALSTSIRGLRSTDARSAFTMAERISKESQRRWEIGKTLRAWAVTDPDAANLALQNTTRLDEEAKKKLRNALAAIQSKEVSTPSSETDYVFPK